MFILNRLYRKVSFETAGNFQHWPNFVRKRGTPILHFSEVHVITGRIKIS